MKRVFLLAALILFMAGCGVRSVDLSGVTFDKMAVGDRFSDIDTSSYKATDRFPEGEGVHNFEECQITERKNRITRINAEFEYADICVNGIHDCKNKEDVIAVLGADYTEKIYDTEQDLMEIEYNDKKKNIKCGFVYSQRDDSLVLCRMWDY